MARVERGKRYDQAQSTKYSRSKAMQVLDFVISTLIYGSLIALPIAIIWDVINGAPLRSRKESAHVEMKDDEPVMATVKHGGAKRDSDRAMAIKIVATPVKSFASMTIRELKKEASGKVRGYSNMTKSQLIEALGVAA